MPHQDREWLLCIQAGSSQPCFLLLKSLYLVCYSFGLEVAISCYKPVALVTPKMFRIVLETFTLKSYLFWFMLPILGWVYLLCISGVDSTENNVICVLYTIFSVSCDTGKVSVFLYNPKWQPLNLIFLDINCFSTY